MRSVLLFFIFCFSSNLIFSQDHSTCALAQPLVLDFTCSGTTGGLNSGDPTGFDGTDGNVCSTNYSGGDDYIFSYVGTGNALDLELYATNTWTGLLITEGCPTSGTCVVSATSSSANKFLETPSLTLGVTYYIQISTWPTPQSPGQFCLNAQEIVPPAAPSNDNCASAQTLNADISLPGTTAGGTSSGVPLPDCVFGGSADDDVWYRVQANVAGELLDISVTGSSVFDAVVVLYSGTCGSLTEVDCADNTLEGDEETISYLVGTAGDYYIRVYEYFTGSGSGDFEITASGPALPITISKISAYNMGKNNMITWTTASEVNNDVQVVERSKDGLSGWELVGKVNGTNSRETVTYEVYDNMPFHTSFYRIHSVDFDGKEQFSKIVSVQREGRSGIITSIQPNPTANFVEIDLQPEFDGDITYTILDVTGKLLKTAVFSAINDALNTHTLDMSDLQSGLYFVTIQGGGINQNAKILKQ